MELLMILLGLSEDEFAARVAELTQEEVDDVQASIGERRDELAGQLEDVETKTEAIEGLEALNIVKAAVSERFTELAAEVAEAEAEEAAEAAALSKREEDALASLADEEEVDDEEEDEEEEEELPEEQEIAAAEEELAAAKLRALQLKKGTTKALGGKSKPIVGQKVGKDQLGSKKNPATRVEEQEKAGAAYAGGWGSSSKLIGGFAAERLGVASEGHEYESLTDVATKLSDAFGTGWDGDSVGQGGEVIAQIKSEIPETLSVTGLGGKEGKGELEAVLELASRQREDQLAEVATGGICAPFAPTYDLFDCGAVPQSPVEGAIPVVSENGRGGIRFPQPMDPSAVRPGIGLVTCADDAAGYAPGGPTPVKPCVRVNCPTFDEVCVTAVTRCICFGNLQFRTYPEWVERALKDLDNQYANVKEIFYLDGIDAASTPVAGLVNPYGAVRSLAHEWMVRADAYRKRHGMERSSTLEVFAPDFMLSVLKLDLINDHSMGLGFLDASDAMVTSTFQQIANISITWYNDSATGAGQTDWAATAAGLWPTTPVSYMFKPGTFVRIDGGSLDIGVFRDRNLIETNDFCIFAEEFIQIAFVGCEALRINHTGFCPTGQAVEAVAALICP